MGCLVQVIQDPIEVTVTEPNCCCNDIIIDDLDITIDLQQINASILRGIVNCTDETGTTPIANAIVVATDGTDYYVGISNEDGEYSIVVPPGTYTIQAYYTGCIEDLLIPSCTCTDPSEVE
jgi:hypothetical protein